MVSRSPLSIFQLSHFFRVHSVGFSPPASNIHRGRGGRTRAGWARALAAVLADPTPSPAAPDSNLPSDSARPSARRNLRFFSGSGAAKISVVIPTLNDNNDGRCLLCL